LPPSTIIRPGSPQSSGSDGCGASGLGEIRHGFGGGKAVRCLKIDFSLKDGAMRWHAGVPPWRWRLAVTRLPRAGNAPAVVFHDGVMTPSGGTKGHRSTAKWRPPAPPRLYLDDEACRQAICPRFPGPAVGRKPGRWRRCKLASTELFGTNDAGSGRRPRVKLAKTASMVNRRSGPQLKGLEKRLKTCAGPSAANLLQTGRRVYEPGEM